MIAHNPLHRSRRAGLPHPALTLGSPCHVEYRDDGCILVPFITIADHVDVNFHLNWKHVAGPPLA